MAQYPLRHRKHDKRILTWIAYYRRVTVHQVLIHQFMARGISPSYGDRVVRTLIREGMLATELLDPERGRASRRVLRLTRDGWRRLLKEPPADFGTPICGSILEYRLQFAEMLSVREREGWTLRLKDEAWPVVRDWARRPYRGRMLNDTERVVQDVVERMPRPDLPLNILAHSEKGIRFIMPVRRGLSIHTRLTHMPPTSLWPPVPFELVCAEMPDLRPASDELQRWSKSARSQVELHVVKHHRSVPLPKKLWAKLQRKRAG